MRARKLIMAAATATLVLATAPGRGVRQCGPTDGSGTTPVDPVDPTTPVDTTTPGDTTMPGDGGVIILI